MFTISQLVKSGFVLMMSNNFVFVYMWG